MTFNDDMITHWENMHIPTDIMSNIYPLEFKFYSRTK